MAKTTRKAGTKVLSGLGYKADWATAALGSMFGRRMGSAVTWLPPTGLPVVRWHYGSWQVNGHRVNDLVATLNAWQAGPVKLQHVRSGLYKLQPCALEEDQRPALTLSAEAYAERRDKLIGQVRDAPAQAAQFLKGK